MANRRVAIRLGTEGKAQVVADLDAIGAAGDTSAARLKRAYERDAGDAEAALQRLARTQEKITAIMPQSAMQMRVDANAGTGFGQWEGSARQSAAAFRELMDAEAKLEARTKAFTASLYPAVAAQQTFDREMANARDLISRGAISLDDYVAKLRKEQEALNSSVAAHGRVGTSAGQQRAAFQQLGFQINDIATSFQGGIKPMTIFAQQGSQVIQALQMMGTEGKGVLGFLGGPWGAVLTAATVVLLPLVAKLFEGNDELGKAVDKLKEHARQSAIDADANRAYARSLEGITDASRDAREALDKLLVSQRQQQSNEAVQQQDAINGLERGIAQKRKDIAAAERDLRQTREAMKLGDEGGALAREASAISARIASINAQIARSQAAIGERQAALKTAQIIGVESDVAANADPRTKEDRRYEDERDRLRARREQISVADYQRELERITALHQAKLKAIQDESRAANDNRQSGREVSLSEAKSIVSGIGGRITSDLRPRSEQERLYADMLAGRHNGPVARPGTSAHERGNALDVAYGPGISLGSLAAAFAAEGVRLTKKLDEPGQRIYHIEWSTAQANRTATQAATAYNEQVKSILAEANRMGQDALRGWKPANVNLFDNPGDENPLWGTEQQHKDRAARAAVNDEIQGRENERREQGIRTAAGLYRDLMTGGVNTIWQRFESYGLDVISNLLAKWTFGQEGGSGGWLGALKGIFGAGSSKSNFTVDPSLLPGHNATGTERWSGGGTWLAENGPELVDLPAGSRVTPAAETRRLLAGNDNAPITLHVDASISAPGADPAALARVEANQRRMEAALPGIVRAAMSDARARSHGRG